MEKKKNQTRKPRAAKTDKEISLSQDAKRSVGRKDLPPRKDMGVVKRSVKNPKKKQVETEKTKGARTSAFTALLNELKSFRRNYRKLLNLVLVLIILVIALWFTDYFEAEKKAVSYFYKFLPHKTSNIVLVEIGDADYQRLFRSQSPLDTQTLERILAAILRGKPRVVGVDIDTSDDRFKNFSLPESSVPMVFAIAPKLSRDGEIEHIPNALEGKENLDFEEGLAIFPHDTEKNSVCCYKRFFEKPRGEFHATFPWRIFGIYKGIPRDAGKSADEYYLQMDDNQKQAAISAEQLLEMSGNEAWEDNGLLKDKIVILGGSYISQEDIKITYSGNFKGYELNAIAIETEMNGILLRPTPLLVRIFLMLVYCLLTIVILHIFEKQFLIAILISVSVFIVLSVVLSLLRYGNGYGVIQYLPALLYMLIAKIADYLYFKESLIKTLLILFKPLSKTK